MESPYDVAIGIDLAWSGKNGTGLAAAQLRNGLVCVTAMVVEYTTQEIVNFIAEHHAEGQLTIVAIDAPTIVPNETGARPCDLALQREFARYAAGAYPANRARLGGYNNGVPRGEEVSRALQLQFGAVECEVPFRNRHGVIVIEVFPSPAHVVLFGLSRSLQYKKKKDRTWAMCCQQLDAYVRHLRALTDPMLALPRDVAVTNQSGLAFKDLEDKLDAVTCAYIAALTTANGNRVRMIGTLSQGYVILPTARVAGGQPRTDDQARPVATQPVPNPLPALPVLSRAVRPTGRGFHPCECGCGGTTQRRFVPGHDSRLRGWLLRLERGVVTLDQIPDGERQAVQRELAKKRGPR